MVRTLQAKDPPADVGCCWPACGPTSADVGLRTICLLVSLLSLKSRASFQQEVYILEIYRGLCPLQIEKTL